MSVRVAINGFGRIGRLAYRAILESKKLSKEIEVVAINDLVPSATNAHLLKHDSNYGAFPGTVEYDANNLIVNGKKVAVCSEKNPADLPWKKMKVDIVVESTGFFTNGPAASGHLTAGAGKVIISAPAKEVDLTVVIGVNDDQYDPKQHRIVSNASCTTNCLAPLTKVLDDTFKIERGLMTTIHSYTNDQKVADQAHKDLRRARAAADNIIPTTTGAARAIGEVLPQLKGKLDGIAIRVPTPTVSLVDLVVETAQPVNVDIVNEAFAKAARSKRLKGILEYSTEELVSSDFKGNPASSIFDSLSTMTVGDHTAKVFSWYDNEWGYSNRVGDLLLLMAK